MTEQEMDLLRYPIGKFSRPESFNSEIINQWISEIEAFPSQLKNVIESVSDEKLNTPYRPGGWTVRQVVHHCSDSHMNAMIRHKLALTEDTPTIKTYPEKLWAELPDSKMPVEAALKLLEGLHERWVVLLKSLTEQDLKKSFFHPDQKRNVPLEESIALYAWHCNHHLGHVRSVV